MSKFVDLSGLTLMAGAVLCAAGPMHLQLKSGLRYDLGAVSFVALGAYGYLLISQPPARALLNPVVAALLVLSSVLLIARVGLTNRGATRTFTLLGLAAFLLTVPLVRVAGQESGVAQGISVSARLAAPLLLTVSVGLFVVFGILVARFRLGTRLSTLVEANDYYRVNVGNTIRASMASESLCALGYTLAGALEAASHDDLSSAQLEPVVLWALAAAAMPAKRAYVYLIAAVGGTVIVRMLIQEFAPSSLSSMLVYVLVALTTWTALVVPHYVARRNAVTR